MNKDNDNILENDKRDNEDNIPSVNRDSFTFFSPYFECLLFPFPFLMSWLKPLVQD